MYFGDMGSNVRTMLMTGAFGLMIAVPAYALLWLFTRRRFPAKPGTHVLRCLFLAYVICVGMLTLAPDGGSGTQGSANLLPLSSVLFAFRSGSSVALQLLFLNVLLFMPLGIFLPWIFPKTGKLHRIALISFCSTLLIETLQVILPGGRAFDVDDILLNTWGGIVGYSLFSLLSLCGKNRTARPSRIVAWAAALALLPAVFLGFSAAENAREFKYNFSYTLGVPEQAEYTGRDALPAAAMTYVRTGPSQEELLSVLMEAFSISGTPEAEYGYLILRSGGASLSVAPHGDSWNCLLREPTGLPGEKTDEQAASEAEAFLRERGLWTDGLQRTVQDTLGVNADGTERPDGKEVLYEAGEDDPTRIGGLSVLSDSGGIYSVSSSLAQFVTYREAELMPPDEALMEVLNTHQCDAVSDLKASASVHPQTAVFDKAELLYMYGYGMQQNLPVWKLSGTFFGDGEQAAGYLLAPAARQ